MKLQAKIMKGSQIVMEEEAILSGQGKFEAIGTLFYRALQNMGISVPMWMGKYKEVAFRRTSFNSDQFFGEGFGSS